MPAVLFVRLLESFKRRIRHSTVHVIQSFLVCLLRFLVRRTRFRIFLRGQRRKDACQRQNNYRISHTNPPQADNSRHERYHGSADFGENFLKLRARSHLSVITLRDPAVSAAAQSPAEYNA